MLKIKKDNTIIWTRGDHAEMEVSITTENGTEYELQEGDVLIFTVKKRAEDEVIFYKYQTHEKKIVIDVISHDMHTVPFGTYVYDLQLRNGDNVFTIIPCSLFVIGEEVGWE